MITPTYIAMMTFFMLSLAVVFLAVRLVPNVQSQAERFGNYLLIRAFPSNADNEHYKFAILRIIFGLILLARALNVQWLLLPDERFGLVGLFSALEIIASLMLLFGFFTQVALVFFMLVMWQIGERVLATSTLGSDVAAIVCLLLLLTSAGRHLSIDSLIIKRWSWFRRIFCYSATPANAVTIALAKFAALFSYWLVCVYSLSMHLNEPAWTTGIAGPLLLTNNFMSAWSAWFESIFVASDHATLAAKVSLWIMMLWYAAVLPLTLMGGWWKRYVIVWGLLFFTLSLVVLNLGSLAEIEFVLWAGLFWVGAGLVSKSKLLLFYDDKCNMCDKTVQIVTYLDVFSKIRLMPVSQNAEYLEKLNISMDDALSDLYGIDERTGQIRSGYSLYFWLTQRIVLLWPVAPILLIGFLFGIGPRLYRRIAVRRRELFGVCQLARPKASNSVSDGVDSKAQPNIWVVTIFVHVLIIGIIYFVSIPAPYLGISGKRNAIVKSSELYGITPINVFNITDIRMVENWFTIDSLDFNQRLPIFTEEGERLQYHRSDRIYFGHTVRYRRGEISSEDCAYERRDKSIEYLAKVWLNQIGAESGSYRFLYTQYFKPLPDINALLENQYIPTEKIVRCQNEFNVSVH